MNTFASAGLSPYDAACEAAEDERAHPQQAELEQLGTSVMTEVLDVLAHTALEDHVTTIGEGLVGAFHSIALRLTREHDRASDEIRRLSRDFAGGEIDDVELQEATRKAHRALAALSAIEIVREAASDAYSAETGETWTVWRGSVRGTATTAAQIDAAEALRNKRANHNKLTAPGDQVVALRGAPMADTLDDANRLYDALNWAKAKWPEMKLATTGAKGAEKLAAGWAKSHGVAHILSRVDFNKDGKAAPFRAGDRLIELDPVCVFTLAHTLNKERAANTQPFGPALNLGQKAETAKLVHIRITHRKA